MPKPLLLTLKTLLHLGLLAPFAWLLHLYRSGALALDPDPVNYITHFTGNWALWILLGDLAITPIRRLSPRLAPLVRFRRMVGLYAFFYATLHLATYVFLFSGFDLPTTLTAARQGHPGEFLTQWKLVWPTIKDDLLKRRFIQVGLFAWFLLLLLAATSPQFVLRLMGGKSWQRLHRLIYVAAVAAIVHYWWLVKSGNREPLRDTLILALLLLARLAYSGWKRRRTPTSKPTPNRATIASKSA